MEKKKKRCPEIEGGMEKKKKKKRRQEGEEGMEERKRRPEREGIVEKKKKRCPEIGGMEKKKKKRRSEGEEAMEERKRRPEREGIVEKKKKRCPEIEGAMEKKKKKRCPAGEGKEEKKKSPIGEGEEEGAEEDREGRFLLGPPTFEELENGRFRCIETGHEVPTKAMEEYGKSKRCRLGLVDYALLHKKPPLNLFKQHPSSKSNLICKLTGDTVNKSEEHIWKHINGKRFHKRLEQKEKVKVRSKVMVAKDDKLSNKPSRSKAKGVKKNLGNEVGENDS